MSAPLIVYFPLVIFLLVGFGTLYWRMKYAKYTEINALEDLQKTKETVEKPWFMPLFMVLGVISCGAIFQDVLVLIPRFSMYSLPLLKYMYALCVGTLTFIGGIIVRRKLKDLQS